MTKYKSFYIISRLGTCLIMCLFVYVLSAYFVVVYLRSKWFSRLHVVNAISGFYFLFLDISTPNAEILLGFLRPEA